MLRQHTEKSNELSQTEKNSDGSVGTDAKKLASRTGRRAEGVRRRTRAPLKNSKTESGNDSPDVKSTKPANLKPATETDSGTTEGPTPNDGSDAVLDHSRRRQTRVRQRTTVEHKSAKTPNKKRMPEPATVDVGEKTLRTGSSLPPPKTPVPASGESNDNADFARDGAPVQARRRGWWQRVTGS